MLRPRLRPRDCKPRCYALAYALVSRGSWAWVSSAVTLHKKKNKILFAFILLFVWQFPRLTDSFFFVFWKVLASNKTLVDLNLSCNNIGAVSVCLFPLYCSHSICMTVLLSQKHFGKLFPPEETGNLVPRAFPREEGGERGHCLPIA